MRKSLKFIFVATLCLFIVLALASCDIGKSKKDDTSAPPTTSQTESSEKETTDTSDTSADTSDTSDTQTTEPEETEPKETEPEETEPETPETDDTQDSDGEGADNGEEEDIDRSSLSVLSGYVYAYDKSGKKINYTNTFLEVDGKTYYVINNQVLTGDQIIDGQAYSFDHNGVKKEKAFNCVFLSVNGSTYYVVNNKILYHQNVIDGAIYDFGADGKMTVGKKGSMTYDSYGRLIANECFVTVNNNTYYLLDSEIVLDKQVINGAIYDFGTDGKMTVGQKNGYTYDAQGKMIANRIFVTVNNNTYYLLDGAVALDKKIIDGAVYDFGTDGKMAVGQKDGLWYDENGKLKATGLFVTVNNNVYYVVDNEIVYNRVVINGAVYDFGNDGKMTVGEKGGYVYNAQGQLIADEIFITINNNTYYIVNGLIVYNQIVIDGAIYDFGNDGKMITGEKGGYTYDAQGKIIADEIFVKINNNTYYLIDNEVVLGELLIDGAAYNFGDNGKMLVGTHGDRLYGDDGKLIADRIFITVNNNVYYFVGGEIVCNGYVVVNGKAYFMTQSGELLVDAAHDGYVFGEDGALMGTNTAITTFDGTQYRIENNEAIPDDGTQQPDQPEPPLDDPRLDHDRSYVEDGVLYAFDQYGNPLDYDQAFIVLNDCTYYILNNQVVTGDYIVNGRAYFFDEEGVMQEKTFDRVFLTINNNTYYVIENLIVYNRVVIDGAVYDFGNDGKMTVGQKGAYTYGEDGQLIANRVFVTVNNNTYYLLNNEVVVDKLIIDGAVYDFGTDGKMAVGQKDGLWYDENGKLEATEIFVTVNNNVYYVIDNEIVYNRVVINGAIYDFGNDGKMTVGEKGGYEYDEQGKLIADEIFITINNNTYYIVNGLTVYNQIVINGAIYDFGNDGKMITGEKGGFEYDEQGRMIAHKSFIVINNNTYYLINNRVVFGETVINGAVYNFGTNGMMITGFWGNREYDEYGRLTLIPDGFLTLNTNDVYYVINDRVIYNEQFIDGALYNFGDDGKMIVGEHGGLTYGPDGKLVAHQIFITINNNVYYFINNVIARDGFVVFEGRVYYLSESGVRISDTTHNGYTFGADGALIGSNFTITTVDGARYSVENNVARPIIALGGTAYESDSDLNTANNPLLSGVTVSLTLNGEQYTAQTDASGRFLFDDLAGGMATVTFTKNGFDPVTLEMNLTVERNLTVVLDRNGTHTLSGNVMIADSDNNLSNNTALSNASLSLERLSSTNTFTAQTTTSSSGAYSFTGLTVGVYRMTIEKEGYIPIVQTVVIRQGLSVLNNVALEAVVTPTDPNATGRASGVLTDSQTGRPVSGMTVYIYSGINTTAGEYVCKTYTNANGCYTTSDLAPGNYTAYVVDERTNITNSERYSSRAIAIKVLPGITIENQGGTIAKGLPTEGLTVILNWGSEPRDLDSYMSFNGKTVYYGHSNDSGCSLDVDDRDGHGPETITVSSFLSCTYTYSVQRFAGAGTIGSSGAVVQVFLGEELVYELRPSSSCGNSWQVFSYNAITGEFTIY